ncbi:MAG: hypothetical protein F4W89_06075 [Acidobacteria bacterium]|nr:hypothetical protein [Acidobacteriota bacterium]
MDADVPDVQRPEHVARLVQRSGQFLVDRSIVANHVALDATAPIQRYLAHSLHVAREERRRARRGRPLAGSPTLVFRQTRLESEREAVEIEIRIGGHRIAAAVTQVDLLVRADDEEVDGVVPVEVVKSDVDTDQVDDARAYEALQQATPLGVYR